jgi:uncharacterized protein
MYDHGQGTQKDGNQAFYWYQTAAKQGDAISQYNTGVMYANGQGVARNNESAIFWIKKSAEQGYQPAQDVVRKLAR